MEVDPFPQVVGRREPPEEVEQGLEDARAVHHVHAALVEGERELGNESKLIVCNESCSEYDLKHLVFYR